MATAFPYHHRKIMTNKFVVTIVAVVWGLAILITSVLIVQVHLYSFARCYELCSFLLIYLIKGFVMVSSTGFIIAINIHLYYKILQSNKRLKENMRLHSECSTTTRQHAAIRKNLQSLIKPTISVSLLGGIDGLINLLIPLLHLHFGLLWVMILLQEYYAIESVIYPLQWIQLLCCPLVYGLYMTKIHRKIYKFKMYHQILS